MSSIIENIAAHDALVQRFLVCTQTFPELFRVTYTQISDDNLVRIGPRPGSTTEVCVHWLKSDWDDRDTAEELIIPAWYLTESDDFLAKAQDALRQEKEAAYRTDAERRRHRAELDERREYERLAAKFGGKS